MSIQSNRLSKEEYENNFSDIHPPFGFDETAVIEANRCFNCFDAPCTKLCPTTIDIPRFIRQIASGDIKGSARTIFSSNIMGTGCSKVCPVEKLCEGVCVYHFLKEKPVSIAKLQRFSTEKALREKWKLFDRKHGIGKKVAVVGAGPAGLSCAHALSMSGVDVTIFEKEKRPGGLMTYGIAGYKVTSGFCQDEIDYILSIGGIQIQLEKELENHFTLEQLRKNYDAVFLGIGLGMTRSLNIPGESLEGVIDAMTFIKQIRTLEHSQIAVGEKVAVIGMGMTAIDAATQAKRLGAREVTLVYRRSVREKPCTDTELKVALLDGCSILWLMSPKEILGENGKVKKLVCEKMILGEPDNSSRRAPVPMGETVTIDVDLIIKATGQVPYETLIRKSSVQDKDGKISINDMAMTTIPGIFAGGDAVSGGKEVVNAVQAGKNAAQAILAYLR
ncbi:MAG: NAD(P)-dependent oxidoreductase [Bacteroidales bacterium]|nr:NAD(P)-dependent oxidoreductase [Bacteroidales bacterium]